MPDKQERRWVIFTALILLGVTTLPYLLGYFRQGADWRFTGFFFGVEDGNSYIAKMLSGSSGSWLFRSPYTAMPQNGVLAFLPYLLLGKLAYPPEIHAQLVVLFQVFRWLAGGLLVWAVYVFCGLFLPEKKSRRLATLIILLGGGLGWLGWMLLPGQGAGSLPLEVYSPEAFGFLSLLGLPHLAAARAFLLLGLVYFLKTTEPSAGLRNAITGGLCWFAVGFFQPLTIVVGYGILSVYLLLRLILGSENRWQNLMPVLEKAAIMAAISSPWVIYNLFFFSADAYLKAWYAQNIISSPPLSDYLWSFGLFLAGSIPAVIYNVRQRDPSGLILPAWIICAAALAYFPYNVQRRFIEGIWIALVLLLFESLKRINQRSWRRLYVILLGSTAVAPILIWLVVNQGVWNTVAPIYRPAKEVAMFTALSDISKPGDTVLAGYETANALPAWDAVFVLAGHGPESARLKEVLPEIQFFYSGDKDLGWQQDFIRRNGIDFIICGPVEQAMGSWMYKYGSEYKRVYAGDDYQVYAAESTDGE